MSLFEDYRKKVAETFSKPIEEPHDSKIEEEKPEEEWVWISGFKGTDKNMMCNDFQYAMDTVFEMPADEIELCKKGFHFCKRLGYVFSYYGVKNGNRFFAVDALVKKSDVDLHNDKFVAKSIIFTRELDVDEILESAISSYDKRSAKFDEWTHEQKRRVLDVGFVDAYWEVCTDKLITYGYSRPFAAHIIKLGGYNVACAVGSQEDLSMDMKAMYIYQSIMMNA